jgi:2-dehydro-3-deoxyphosphogalactonate aldolase
VPLENKHAMGLVARSTTVPIATGERLTTKWEFQQVLENDAAAIIQVNVGLNGLLESKKIAGMAEAHYAQIAPWTYCGPINAAASIQLDVCSPNFLIQEGIEDWTGFAAQILREPIRWENGFVIPSDRPGLGLEPDESTFAKYPPHEFTADLLDIALSRFDEMGPAIAKYV